jgi:hypothetical protein
MCQFLQADGLSGPGGAGNTAMTIGEGGQQHDFLLLTL